MLQRAEPRGRRVLGSRPTSGNAGLRLGSQLAPQRESPSEVLCPALLRTAQMSGDTLA